MNNIVNTISVSSGQIVQKKKQLMRLYGEITLLKMMFAQHTTAQN